MLRLNVIESLSLWVKLKFENILAKKKYTATYKKLILRKIAIDTFSHERIEKHRVLHRHQSYYKRVDTLNPTRILKFSWHVFAYVQFQ